MTQTNKQAVSTFFQSIARGEVPEDLVTEDMTFWSVNAGTADKARFCGAMKILAQIFGGTMQYHVESLTAEEDRVVAEIRSHGTFTDGEPFDNTHLFLFRFRDGRIAEVKEFMNQLAVREKVVPRMLAVMGKS